MVKVIAIALGLAMALPVVAARADGTVQPVPQGQVVKDPGPKPTSPQVVRPQFAGQQVLLCFTCGRAWPFHIATIHLGSGAKTFEAGGNCSNPVTFRSDTSPFVCSN